MVFNMLLQGTLETIYMVFFSGIVSLIIGFPCGILGAITSKGHIFENKTIYRILNGIINVTRSFPYIILMILLLPLSRLIIGTTIGSTATIIPLSISAAPFVARVVENCVLEVDRGVIEASESLGASNFTIIRKVIIPEALPSLVQGITLLLINLIGLSAMAGAIGGGGLGDLAIRFGYNRFKVDIMIYSVLVIILLVQGIQLTGNLISNRLKKNGR
ncbi:D-methionine transport system permease protein [Cetobacterium ceti]|uniref:D-methionine transport system permease protein n=1 Tax=Cetobacterium ceti TaxID=180163 RepID=A0A1T4K6L0_9FUSO|nr:methionine ABC transporter permease [Cetobacterium ceti]SJZ37935.1 D-methionine transport system permease protein [Cetobacterium ceti]